MPKTLKSSDSGDKKLKLVEDEDPLLAPASRTFADDDVKGRHTGDGQRDLGVILAKAIEQSADLSKVIKPFACV